MNIHKKGYKRTFLQKRNRIMDFENKLMVKQRGQVEGGGVDWGLGFSYEHCGTWNGWSRGHAV